MKSHEIRVTPTGKNSYPFKRMATGDHFWLSSDCIDSAARSACQFSRRNNGKRSRSRPLTVEDICAGGWFETYYSTN